MRPSEPGLEHSGFEFVEFLPDAGDLHVVLSAPLLFHPELFPVVADELLPELHVIGFVGRLHLAQKLLLLCHQNLIQGAEPLPVAFHLFLHLGIRVLPEMLPVG